MNSFKTKLAIAEALFESFLPDYPEARIDRTYDGIYGPVFKLRKNNAELRIYSKYSALVDDDMNHAISIDSIPKSPDGHALRLVDVTLDDPNSIDFIHQTIKQWQLG
jgi:hypothetical protein